VALLCEGESAVLLACGNRVRAWSTLAILDRQSPQQLGKPSTYCPLLGAGVFLPYHQGVGTP
jgi:hypothetical protein